jgi:hypothetical protein
MMEEQEGEYHPGSREGLTDEGDRHDRGSMQWGNRGVLKGGELRARTPSVIQEDLGGGGGGGGGGGKRRQLLAAGACAACASV